MMSFKNDCIELFGTCNLYQILKLEKSSSLSDAKAKKAYYQQSILWHPDRFSSQQHDEAAKELAKRKFQIIGRAYSILGVKEKRKVYDETGLLDDEDDLDETKDWATVWRGTFKKVTLEEIEAYLEKFRGSKEEMEEVKKAYIKHKGNMDLILESVVGAELQNEDRIREIIHHFIALGELQAFTRFLSEPPTARAKRVRKAQREAKEAEQALREMKQGGENTDGDLTAMILAKQRKRVEQQDNFLEHLTKKYGDGEGTSTKKTRKGKK